MKTLYVRPGAKDHSGNPVGFKAERGSKEAQKLLRDGYKPQAQEGEEEAAAEITDFTADDLMAMDVKQLKALAKTLGLRGYGNLHEVQLVAAIMAAQSEGEAGNGEGEHGGADNQTPPTDL
jgi:hypothetical protein